MKKIFLLAVLFSLTACQQTTQITETQAVTNRPVGIADIPTAETTTAKSEHKPVHIEKLPHEHDDLWQRIRSQLSIEVPDNQAVAKWRKYYLSHPNFMVTISQRAEPFLYYIVQEIEKRNMPIELALLPIVESAYLPYGISNKSAAGLWQFMPVSANRFNLAQNWWYDGRRDIVESTRAALDYFQFFHRSLGQDWLNAIAAFNSGEGRVGRAIAKNRKANLPTDFWSLRLPSETTNFVPKLLAIADILKHSAELNYTFTPIKNRPAVTLVALDSQLDLTLASQWTNIDANAIFQLNPGLKRRVTPPDSQYQLLMPIAVAGSFKDKLASTNKKEWLRWQRHKVKSGDSLSVLAHQYAIDVDAIKRLNQLSSDTIRIGDMLIVPFTHHDVDGMQLAGLNQNQMIYTVKSGDNLWNISRKYKVKVQDLLRWNRLSSNSLLQPKQKLRILL